MSKIAGSLNNLRDRIRVSISVRAQNMLFFIALFLIVVLAIMIRLTPFLRGPYLINEFDSWIQYYSAQYLSTHTVYEYFHWYDFKSWYPEGSNRGDLRPGLQFTVVIIYQIIHFIGIPVTILDVCYFFAPFIGGLTALVMYFLGKEILNRQCGLFAAFFLAFNPGHIQRTIASFFDNEPIGVFAALLTFLFFLKAVRTGKISYSILGGLFLGYLTLSWGGYEYIFLLLPLICIVLILMNIYDENVLISYAGVQGTGLLIFALYSIFNYNDLFSNLSLGGIFLFTIILIVFHLIHTKKTEFPKFYKWMITSLKWAFIPGVVVFAIILWVKPDLIPLGLGGRLQSVITPLIRNQLNLTASVAEHQPSAWSVFYYNILIPLILLPLGIFFCFKRSIAADVFLISFLLTLFYATGSMIRIVLLFAPAASLMAAYGLTNVLKIFGSFVGERKFSISRKRRRQLKTTISNSEVFTVYFIVGFLCIAQVVHATNISINQLSYHQMVPGGQFHDWEETLLWMKTNLPGTAVVVSWWDYGYWLTAVGNVTTVNDNATVNQTRIGLTGMAFMQTNELYSAKIFRLLKADYVLVYFGYLHTGLQGDDGKWPWMVRICNDNYQSYKKMGLEEDNWAKGSVFDESEYINKTSGNQEKKWFDSQLVRLMFYGVPTVDIGYPSGSLVSYYISQLTSRKDDEGNTWNSYIPENGAYSFKAFQKEYFSQNGLVKLYKIDYTALDSSFLIEDTNVYDNGYSTFTLKNTGIKDLLIKNVRINNQGYNFTLNTFGGSNTLESDNEVIVWVDTSSTSFELNDVVNLTVTAEAEALKGNKYLFNETTSEFLVSKNPEGAIKINRENSKVVHSNDNSNDLYLEVENVGDSIENLKNFYVNTEANQLNVNITHYVNGSSILQPGEKAAIQVANIPANFNPLGAYNKIGVITSTGVKDETIFSSNYEHFKISILDENRVVSPEVLATGKSINRDFISINFSKTIAYTNDSGTTELYIKVKNTGDTVLGIDSVNLTNADSWNTVYSDFILTPGQDNTIIMRTASPYIFDVNDEIFVSITASFDGTTIASDVGFVHTIRDKPDIQIIENIDSFTSSLIAANETGRLLIKNTGNVPVSLNKIYVNNTTEISFNNVAFIYGDAKLGVQECAIVAFNIPNLKINASNIVKVNVTTNTTAQAVLNFNAQVDNVYYNITIDATAKISPSNLLTIKIISGGLLDTNLDAIYINNTFIPLVNFTRIVGSSYTIGNLGEFITFTINLEKIEDLLGAGSVDDGDKLRILARTREGAESTHIETVMA